MSHDITKPVINQRRHVRRAYRHCPILIFTVMATCYLAGPSVTSLRAQTYLQAVGVPTFSTNLPVENGFINASNGNLHLEIPLGTFPQRGGHQFKATLMYDSSIWYQTPDWQPYNVSTVGGWRVVTSANSGFTVYGEVDSGYCAQTDDSARATYSPFIWTAPDGTQHSFPITTIFPMYEYSGCPGESVPTGAAYASDGSGYYMSVTGYIAATVYAPDGSIVYSDPYSGVLSYPMQVRDSNGNYYPCIGMYLCGSPIDLQGGTQSDMLGRNVIASSSSGSTAYLDVLNSQGSTSRYTVTLENISVSTSFGVSGSSEFSGSITVIQSIGLPDGTSYSFTYDAGTSGNYGQLQSMTLPTGGTIHYSPTVFTDAYGNKSPWITGRTTPDGSWSYTPYVTSSCSLGQVNCQQQLTLAAPSGDTAVYTFTLNGGAWPTKAQYYSGSSTLLATTTQCFNFVTLSSGSCTYSIATAAPATNVYKTAMTTTLPIPGSNVSATTEYSWSSGNNGQLTQMSEWNFGSSVSGAADRTTTISYLSGSSYGAANIVNRATNVAVTNSGGGLVAKTVNSYDGSSLASATGKTEHDDTNYGTGNTVRGNLTQVQRYVTSSSSVTTSMAYDMTGQVVSSYDGNSNLTSYDYSDNFYTDSNNTSCAPSSYSPSGATNAYLKSITKGSLVWTFGYYWGTGQRALFTDPNSQTTCSHYYDSLSRPTSTLFPDSGWNYGVYSSSGTQVDVGTGIASTSLSTSCSTSGSDCRHDETLLDGLGRTTSQILVSDPDGQDTVSTTYDSSGRVSSVSNPQRSSSSPSDGTESYTYDGLSRPTVISRADGSAVYTYYGAAVSTGGGRTSQICSEVGYPVLTIDEAGNKRQTWTDAFGRVIEADEPTASSNSLTAGTCYSYDLNNNLTGVVAAGGTQTRSFSYDMLSRLTSATNPESGTISYVYDGNGNVTSRTGPKQNQTGSSTVTTTYTIDFMDRVTAKSYNDSLTPSVTLYYDQTSQWGSTIANSKGRLTAAQTPYVASELFSYDPMGRPVWQFQQTPLDYAGYFFVIEYTYNLAGGITQHDDGLGDVFYQSFDGAGRVYQVGSNQSDSQHPNPLATVNSSAGYWPAGEIRQMLLGNGLTETSVYNNRLQPCRINVNSSGTGLSLCSDSTPSNNIQDFGQGFNAGTYDNGNVTYLSGVGNQAFTRTYTYDYLNRLSSYSTPSSPPDPTGCYNMSWSYDQFGNRTQTGTGGTCGSWTVSYNSANKITSPGLSYDAAGNVSGDGSHTYFYDAENRLIQVDGTLGTCASATACYLYDYGGRRVQRIVSGGTPANYLYDLDGRVNSEIDLAQGSFDNSNHKLGWVASYIYLDGSLLAEYANNTTYFVHGDQIGSTRLLTDTYNHGCVVDSLDYLPYGELYGYPPACSAEDTALKFTGEERDSESNLDNSQARYYLSNEGRFMLPDPAGLAVADVSNPQTWNQYAYVLNNPLTLTDPTGLCGSDFEDDGSCDDGFGIDISWPGLRDGGGFPYWTAPSVYIPPSVGNPFNNETNGIPNGLQIPTLGLPDNQLPSDPLDFRDAQSAGTGSWLKRWLWVFVGLAQRPPQSRPPIRLGGPKPGNYPPNKGPAPPQEGPWPEGEAPAIDTFWMRWGELMRELMGPSPKIPIPILMLDPCSDTARRLGMPIPSWCPGPIAIDAVPRSENLWGQPRAIPSGV